ncbi:hypothetical protein C0991_010160 [Blastosporella zonata]|nr:hypothetical protein C0991_010160 [Blastosporella zonata]
MQAVHQLPPMLGHHYPHHVPHPGPSAMPTPPLTTRKRKRAHQYTVSYSEVQEVDSDGTLREVIVIEDTPPPPTMSPATTHNGAFSASYQPPVYSAPIRTRARAAAEAQALSASSSSAIVAPAPKKRKRDHPEEVRAPAAKKLATSGHQTQQIVQTKSWDSKSTAATEDASKSSVCDDKEGHYIIVPDDLLYRRYRTVRLLGQGTFGKVVEAVDTQTNSRVAIKIIRAIPKYRDASKIEVRVLQKLKERDPLNRNLPLAQ